MRTAATIVFALTLGGLMSCSADDSNRSSACEAVDVDLGAEPTWDATLTDYRRWYRDGCPVRVDVITDRPAPEHCGWSSARVISLNSLAVESIDGDREFVRDPGNIFGFSERLRVIDDLPPTAIDTGYSSDDAERLWIDSSLDSIYIVSDGLIERWPQAESPLCM